MANLADPEKKANWQRETLCEEEAEEGSQVLILVGGSHAARMAAAAEALEYAVIDLSRPGLRITEESVAELEAELREAVDNCGGNAVIIFHLYDNNVYFSAGEDGSRSLPVKSGGKYHIPGTLEYADRHVLKKLVNTTAPLLRAGGECKKYVLSPLLRYLTLPCCDDPSHLTNRREKRKFIKTMAARNREMRDEIKDLVFGKRIKNFKVLSPNILLLTGADDQEQAASLSSLWDEDPVHLVPGKYEVLITSIVVRLASERFTNAPGDKQPPQPNSSTLGGGVPSHHLRQSWVSTDDTVAHRNYGYEERDRGGRGPRGRNRGGRGGRRMGRPFRGGRFKPY
jgi:hypothetical protein